MLAAGLLIGCNIMAPSLSFAATGPAVAAMPDCHQTEPKGGVAIPTCKASCLAITAAGPVLRTAAADPMALHPALVRFLDSRQPSPDIPPPRSL